MDHLIKELELVLSLNTAKFVTPVKMVKQNLESILRLIKNLQSATRSWAASMKVAGSSLKGVKVSNAAGIRGPTGAGSNLMQNTAAVKSIQQQNRALEKLLKTENRASATHKKFIRDQVKAAKVVKQYGYNVNLVTTAKKRYSAATAAATSATGHFVKQTKGGIRVMGQQGLLWVFAQVRNQLLLIAFALAGAIRMFKSFVSEAINVQMSMAGVQSIARGMGHDVDRVTEIVQKFADTGLLTLKEAANSMKMLISMQGVSVDMAEQIMQALLDWAAFNRLG